MPNVKVFGMFAISYAHPSLSISISMSLLALVSQCISGSLAVKRKEQAEGNERYFWLHSLIATTLTSFSGGFIAPLLIGQAPIPFNNEHIFLSIILSWAAVHNLGMQDFLESKTVKCVWSFFVGLFRTHSVINMTIAASAALPANKYGEIAFFGPIITATFLGSCGLFFPPKSDFYAAIRYNCPWPLQGALITACATHIFINDANGPVGGLARSVIGDVSLDNLKLCIALMHEINIFGQALISPSFNMFELLHYYGYILMPHLQGPKPEPGKDMKAIKSQENLSFSTPLATKELVERTFEYGRVSLFVLFVSYLVQAHLLQPTIVHGGYSNGLAPGAPGLGRCQVVPFLRGCTAYELSLKKEGGTYQLAVSGASGGKKAWKASAKASLDDGDVKAFLGKDGTFKIGTCSKALWSSAKKCPAGNNVPNYITLDDDGVPSVICGADGSSFTP